jgi:TetR/AcrR family transcriptional regulator, lmrAB and yxaGH operons repressor
MREPTKQRMLKTAADLLHRQGYASTGLNQILAESKAPRGSLYFHFPGGKEELVAQAIAGSADELTALLERLLASAPDARAALDAIVAYFRGQLEQSSFTKGCPVATVALEQAATSDALHGACAAAYRRWAHLIAIRLEAEGLPEERASSLANLCLATIEGALVLARAHRSVEPLLRAGAELRELLPAKRKERR